MTNLWSEYPVRRSVYNPETDTLVRQSRMNAMELCEWRVGYENQDGYIQPVSEQLAFGTCTHYIIEQDLRTGEEQFELLANMKDWVEQILVEQYEWSLDLVPDIHLFFSELGVAYRTWRIQIRPQLEGQKVLAIEQEMMAPLGPGQSGTIHLKGTSDLILEEQIRDIKTAGRGWTQDKADMSIQPNIYSVLVKQNLKRSIRDFVFDVYDRSTSSWQSYATSRTINQINASILNAYQVGRKIEAHAFTASPVVSEFFKYKRGWYCSPKWCSAWNICDYKYIPDKIDESILAIRSWS